MARTANKPEGRFVQDEGPSRISERAFNLRFRAIGGGVQLTLVAYAEVLMVFCLSRS